MRIITWVIAACLGIGLITYGITAFGEQEASAEISQEAKGSLVRLDLDGKKLVIAADGKEAAYPLSSNVWVYRDMQKSALEQLQAGDAVDLILNSKKQAAYIKAASPQFAAAAQPSAAASNNSAVAVPEPSANEPSTSQPSTNEPKAIEASQSHSTMAGASAASANKPNSALAGAAVGGATAPPIVDTKPAGAALPPVAPPLRVTASTSPASEKSQSSEAARPSKDVRAQLDKLSLEWKSRGLLLKIKREGSSQSGKATDVYIQTNDRSVIHLTGSSAEALVQQLIQGLPMEQKAFEEQLKSRISTHFQTKDEKVEWKLDTKWQQAAMPSSNKSQGQGPQEVKNQDKAWDKAKGRDQDKGKGNSNSKEKDRDEDRDKDRDKDR
jgi:hypothetical protein